MRYVEFMKKVVPLHDDLFDFFYEALPGYEHVGERRILLGCWGSLQRPRRTATSSYENMTDWGRKMFVTPGVVVDGKLVTNDLVDINLGIRILLGHSYYDDWDDAARDVRRRATRWATRSTAGTRGTSTPSPRRRSATSTSQYSWTMSPRWFDGTDHLALDTGGGPIARLWSTALSGLVDIGYVKATGHSVEINLPRTALQAGGRPSSGRSRSGATRSSATGPGPTSRLYAACAALHFVEKALAEVRAGRTETWTPFKVPDEAISCRLHRGGARRAQPPHGDPGRQDRELPPVPADAVERQRARRPTARPARTRTRCRTRRSSRRTRRRTFKGIDIMRAVRSFDPCLPCGVHMYTGNGGKVEAGRTRPSVAVKPY